MNGRRPPLRGLSRRRFLALSGGLAIAGCTTRGEAGRATTTTAATTSTTLPAASTAATTVTTIEDATAATADDRILVLVELAGGNDAVNTLVPLTGRYHDLRPTIGLEDDDLVAFAGHAGHGFHPALAPLRRFADEGRLATLAGIGFPDPDLSHFVSLDRWWRADRLDETAGWLGRWLDAVELGPEAELGPLDATAIGHDGEVLIGSRRRGTVIDSVDAFALPDLVGAGSIRRLAGPDDEVVDPLITAARQAHLDTVGAVEEFDTIADGVRAGRGDDDAYGERSRGFTISLAIAAELIASNPGTRVVTVSVPGFDTHSDQREAHAGLLADLAEGLSSFWDAVETSGDAERVLLATQSEFGRRVPENGSAGCDHGAGGVSFVMGASVRSGLHGAIDLDDLAGVDLRPTIDPRTMFTACLDWLGADVEPILGRRHDEIDLVA